MDKPWHFVHLSEAQGPVDGAGLVRLAAQGIVTADTLLWRPGQTEWVAFSIVEELAEGLRTLEEQEPAAKRRRLGAGGGAGARPPSPQLQEEIPSWVEALDEGSNMGLFERALFRHLADVIHGRPALRDELLAAYVQRHPESADKDPASYAFSDAFLLDAVDNFESREEMWQVLGADNTAAVHGVITAAARLDRRYCAQLHASSLLSQARRLVRGGDGAGLVQLLREEDTLAQARDLEGRTLWHDLVVGQQPWPPGAAASSPSPPSPPPAAAAGPQLDLVRLLLPELAAAGRAACPPAGQQPCGEQQDGKQQRNGEEQQQPGEHQQNRDQQQQEEQPDEAGEMLVQVNGLNIADFGGNTPLHLAAEAAEVEVARLLLDAGANPDMQNRDTSKYATGDWSVRCKDLDFAIPVPSLHQTPLHIAAESGDLDMLRLLVGRGAALDLRDTAGSTPLHLALEAQDERAVELLLQAGANCALSNNDMGDDSTPLHQAASTGQPGILRLLLATGKLAGAVNKAGEQGFTPLHLAARRGSRECVALLLEHGAAHDAVNALGMTPLDIADVNKREAVVALLQGQQPAAA